MQGQWLLDRSATYVDLHSSHFGSATSRTKHILKAPPPQQMQYKQWTHAINQRHSNNSNNSPHPYSPYITPHTPHVLHSASLSVVYQPMHPSAANSPLPTRVCREFNAPSLAVNPIRENNNVLLLYNPYAYGSPPSLYLFLTIAHGIAEPHRRRANKCSFQRACLFIIFDMMIDIYLNDFAYQRMLFMIAKK